MLISHSHKFMFFHVPKAAGISLSYALLPYIHYDLNLKGWSKKPMLWLFRKLKKKYKHEDLNYLEKQSLIWVLNNLSMRGTEKLNYVYIGGKAAIFNKLALSYLNKEYPRIYSRLMYHDTAQEVKHQLSSEVFSGYYKFAVVRHPHDWLVSMYSFLKQRKDIMLSNYFEKFHSFESFIHYLYEFRMSNQKLNLFGDVYFQTVSDFLYDEEGRCLVDKIVRFENLPEDVDEVCEQLDLEITLPHRNKSKHDHFTQYYNEDLWNKAKHILKRDFELLEYESAYQDSLINQE